MIEYKFDEKNNRVISYDNNKIIGKCVYELEDNCWNIVHTEVCKTYQGKGIARKLVNEVILNAKKNNKKVIAECSYAKKKIENT